MKTSDRNAKGWLSPPYSSNHLLMILPSRNSLESLELVVSQGHVMTTDQHNTSLETYPLSCSAQSAQLSPLVVRIFLLTSA